MVPRIYVAKGNRKIHPNFGAWSLPAPDTCPMADKCLNYCSRFKVQKGVSTPRAAWGENLFASRRKDFAKRMIARILEFDLLGVRVHASGDFFSKPYVNAWATIADRLDDRIFWAYTKSLHLNLSPLEELSNFALTRSFGGLLDKRILKTKHNYAVVVDNLSQVKANEFTCPAEMPGVKLSGLIQDTWCGNKCFHCLPPNGTDGKQIRVAFLKQMAGWNGPTELAARRLAALRGTRLSPMGSGNQQVVLNAKGEGCQ